MSNNNNKCKICESPLSIFLDLGDMPIANRFLEPHEFKDEKFYKLEVGFCESCSMTQLVSRPPDDELFTNNYPFFTSTSKYMVEHFKRFALELYETHLKTKIEPTIVELGCNDGVFLRALKTAGCTVVGVEPSKTHAQLCRDKNIAVCSDFFNNDTANNIYKIYGFVDIIYAANTMCHIVDLQECLYQCHRILQKDGVLIFEDPYLPQIFQRLSYDQFYDEHFYYFSLCSVTNLAKLNGFELISVTPLKTHGGSMRYVLKKQQSDLTMLDNYVAKLYLKEKADKFHELSTYNNFSMDVTLQQVNFVRKIEALKKQGKRFIGYGATSKSSVILNSCNFDNETVEAITDNTPEKIGKFSPGMHIPIVTPMDFTDSSFNPKIWKVILFAWNHFDEIKGKEPNDIDWLFHVNEDRLFSGD